MIILLGFVTSLLIILFIISFSSSKILATKKRISCKDMAKLLKKKLSKHEYKELCYLIDDQADFLSKELVPAREKFIIYVTKD